MSKSYQTTIIIVISIVYFIAFGLLFLFEGADWPLKGFFDSVVGVFLGAGAIGFITSMLFIFQSKIQSENSKKESVFERKMALYDAIITEFEQVLEDAEISKDEEKRLFFTQLRVLLLSSPKTLEAYSKLIGSLRDDTGEVSAEIGPRLLEFIEQAREDLDVQVPMTANERASYNSALQVARSEAAKSVSSKRVLSDEYKLDVLSQLDNAQRGESSAILERENLYWSQISTWRKQRDAGKLK